MAHSLYKRYPRKNFEADKEAVLLLIEQMQDECSKAKADIESLEYTNANDTSYDFTKKAFHFTNDVYKIREEIRGIADPLF